MQFLELQKLSDLDLILESGQSHIGVHVRSRSTRMPITSNLEKRFVERPESHFIRSSLGDDLKN